MIISSVLFCCDCFVLLATDSGIHGAKLCATRLRLVTCPFFVEHECFFLGILSPIIVVSNKLDTHVTHVLFASCGLSFSYMRCFDCSKPSLLP